ncbi:hypothetical protein [Ehrlichia canis]|uniref:hypothetical protein n=1 Tax=Ehrlichia canis TaxID=944 RepID=UPI000C84BD3E|nr:hypothetical protein [Ehrlichia canis]AUO54859.1 hypothetical protein C1I72_03130 [Ehrlichia canis]UKC53629.1 hypothetical protein s20019040002_000672 [Ehrlichia canis]UKC54567.1 hypothetical protein s20026770001_000673 [Ehrlichia canis]UKC55503.1 hypothetical protein s21009500007_000673 [Ehrlichia canis]
MRYNRVKYYDTLYEGDEQALDDQSECVNNNLPTNQNDSENTPRKVNEDIKDTLSSKENNFLGVFSDIHGCVNNNLQNDQSNSEIEKIDERVKGILSNKVKNDDLIIFEDVHEGINDRSAYENTCGDVNNNFLNSTGSDNSNNICTNSAAKAKKKKVLRVYSDNSVMTEVHDVSVIDCIEQSRSLI